MNIVEHYNNLYHESVQKIKSGHYQLDPLIDAADDDRFGITLILRPGIQVKKNIQTFLSDLKSVEPGQYYYPNSDIHVTVMSIISCYRGFDLSQISIPDYVALIKKCIPPQNNIRIQFRGITASPSCIMVQGFLGDDTLNEMRDRLRINFKNSDLQQTIDQRYTIQTAHATVVRFRKTMSQKEDFIKILDDYRDYNFGTAAIPTISLVHNDWYQRKERVKELYRFKI